MLFVNGVLERCVNSTPEHIWQQCLSGDAQGEHAGDGPESMLAMGKEKLPPGDQKYRFFKKSGNGLAWCGKCWGASG